MLAESKITNWIKGHVRGEYVNLKTGERIPAFEHSNVTTYGAADIMARILGGEQAYVPKHMGFIYGASASPSNPPMIEPPTDRVQTWSSLGDELADVVGNVLISPLSAGPGYAVDGNSDYYTGNSVTLTAQTGSRLEYGFTPGGLFAPELQDGDYIWHALLLTRLVSGSTITYLPFARVTLKDTSYPQKLAGFELALYWAVTYF